MRIVLEDSGSQISRVNAKLAKEINQNEDKNETLLETGNVVTNGPVTIRKTIDREDGEDLFKVNKNN